MAVLVHRMILVIACSLLMGLIMFASRELHLETGDLFDISNPAVPSSRRLLSRADGTGATAAASGVALEDQTIHARERLAFTYDLGGYVFNASGRSHGLAKAVTSSLIHSFSPFIEREAGKRFIDPPHGNIFFANSPAVLWFRGELWLVCRIWLDREKYEPKEDWPANHFADNWLYTQRFDRHMRPVSNGSIVGIPSPKQWWVGDGPIEPRLVAVNNRIFVTFNAAMMFSHQNAMDFTIMWDLEQNLPVIPRIKGGSPMINASAPDDMPRDKHWMALVDDNQLYFVQNLDPLRIMQCSEIGFCEFIHYETDKRGFIFDDNVSHLRGGTPFVLYEYPYYISVAHGTLYKSSSGHRYYTSHFVVMRVKPYRVVYVSNDIKIHPKIYEATPMVRKRYIDDGFIFPVGLILESRNVVDIGVHVNDHSSIIIRLTGVEALLKRMIALDKRDSPKRGPPIGYLHAHIHDVMEKLTKLKFVHGNE